MTFSSQPSSSAGDGGDTTIAVIHPDVIRTHILPRLDGPSLSSAACVSSLLRALSSDDGLWRDLCNSAWPSTRHPRLLHLISSFPSGHRSFFSDAFPLFPGPRRSSHSSPRRHHPPPSELISAVDVSYKNNPVFSTAMDTDTSSSLFGWAPFLVDVEPCVPIPEDFETAARPDDLTVSWILLDSEGKRAANLASRRPVSVQRRRLTASSGELLQLRYATVVAGGECAVVVTAVVTCGGKRGGKAHVRDVSMEVEDMDGRKLSGDESLVILREAVVGGTETTSYEEFEARRAERRARKDRRERRQEMVSMAVGIFVYVALCWVLLSR